MSRRMVIRLGAGVLSAVALAGVQLLSPTAASAAVQVAAPRVLFYDASRASEPVPAGRRAGPRPPSGRRGEASRA